MSRAPLGREPLRAYRTSSAPVEPPAVSFGVSDETTPAAGAGRGKARLPGDDLIDQGLADLARGVESIPALLVSIGAPRLLRLGFAVPNPIPSPELRLYGRLAQAEPDAAHSRYNALIRRLVSFERAVACAS